MGTQGRRPMRSCTELLSTHTVPEAASAGLTVRGPCSPHAWEACPGAKVSLQPIPVYVWALFTSLQAELTGGLGQRCPQGAEVGEPWSHWSPAQGERPMACSPQRVAVCELHTPGARRSQSHGLPGVRVPEPGPAPCLGGSCQ